ncbi:phosphoanhydride phosphohydrolase [Gluconobacter frateurii M-2]|nr:phosphoanhydride phosphohydrolase [Gluconobacter frateurii M-2]
MICRISSLLVLFVLGGCASQTQGDTLEKVVFLGRHGIRSPTVSPQEMQRRTGHAWQTWSVAPGEMTDHGTDALRAMVRAVRENYSQTALFQSPQSCQTVKQETVVWADTADHRTRQTGEVWAEDIAPGCSLQAGWASTPVDPLFNAFGNRAGKIDSALLEREFEVAKATLPEPASDAALKTLQALLAPNGCAAKSASSQCLTTPTTIEWKKGAPRLQGGFVTAGMAAESLLLAYAEGLPLTDFGIAEQDVPHLLETVMPAHEAENHLLRRLPEYARARNGMMAESIRAFLSDQPVHAIPAILPSTKVLVLAGHDTNLAAMMTLFGVEWSFSDQPDSTAPNTVLAFERWRHSDGTRDVRLRVFHQSLEELREARVPDIGKSVTMLSPARSVFAP